MRVVQKLIGFMALSAIICFPLRGEPADESVKIGNYFVDAPYGIALIMDDATGFVINPVWDQPANSRYGPNDPSVVPPGTTAPDFSFVQTTFPRGGARVRFTWGRVGSGAVVGRLETDRPVALSLRCPTITWPHFHASYTAAPGGFEGYAIKPAGEFVRFAFRARPAPALVRANVSTDAEIVFSLDPKAPTVFVAGVGEMPPLDSVNKTLDEARARYTTQRVAAEGDWGDFLGAIMDNLNNLRLYGSDNKSVVHAIGRGWWMGTDPDLFPYFVWDLSFSGLMSSLEDPASGRETVRTLLSFQTPDGRVPSFSHSILENRIYVTTHRSMPPVTAMCVWKMHERHPSRAFLEEVYSRLVRWHDWWMNARDGNRNGLLEWGSEQHWWQGAQFETGWDDNVTYIGTMLDGTTMNADAVDLSSLWSMDAEYLARIARALGKAADAERFEREHQEMNRRINERLWNEEMGIYCSRFWEIPASEGAAVPADTIFKSGVDIRFYRDLGLLSEAAAQHDAAINYDWGEAGPVEGVPAAGWSARVTGVLTAPGSGTYRIKLGGSRDLRFSFDGRAIEKWMYDSEDRRVVDLELEAGKIYPIVLEYFRDDQRRARLNLTFHPLLPGKPGSDWLTRLTPMNFYPLMAGAADKARAEKTLAWMYREDKFWLPFLIPTVAKDDPVWHEQGYWHGNIWPPANYLIWLGVKRYADPAHQGEFARRSVNLFMRNWTKERLCGENYKSLDGTVNGMPHYSWGPLLCEIGLEALVEVGPDFQPVPRADSGLHENLILRRVPFGGKLYRFEARGGKVTVTEER